MNEVDFKLSSWKKFHLTIYLSILTDDERKREREKRLYKKVTDSSPCVEGLGEKKRKQKERRKLAEKRGRKKILIMQE